MPKLRKDMTPEEKKKYNANINQATTKTVVTKSGVKITGTGSSSYPKKLVKGSMTTGPKFVEVKPPKKASTKYSPVPMSAAAKKLAAEKGAMANARTKTQAPKFAFNKQIVAVKRKKQSGATNRTVTK